MSSRHYGLDWLRIGAFSLLLLQHTAMLFVPGTWLIKVPHPVEALVWPMLVVQPWRMPLLFVVSGYATLRLIERSPDLGAFMVARSVRLLLPLLFGVALITPPQLWVAIVESQGYRHDLAYFWVHDWFRFTRIGKFDLPNLGHLWFLTYLWTYTLAMAGVLVLGGAGIGKRLAAAVSFLQRGSRLLWLPLAILLPLRLSLLFTVPEESGLLHDWVSDVNFVPPFLLGFLLAGHPGLWRTIRSVAAPAAIAAAIAACALLFIEYRFPQGHTHLVQAADRACQFVLAWSMILLLLAAADLYGNRDHPLRGRLNDAVFPLYIAHQTVLVLAAWWLIRQLPGYWALGGGVLLVTCAGSWLFYEIARRSGMLRPFLGLAPRIARPAGRKAGGYPGAALEPKANIAARYRAWIARDPSRT